MYLVNKKKGVIDLGVGTFTYFNFGNRNISHTVKIGSRETQLIKLLASRQGSLVTKEEILSTVWEGQIVCDNSASVALSNIRKLFRRIDVNSQCLVTITGHGYIFYPQRAGFIIEGSILC